jgi:protein TonB
VALHVLILAYLLHHNYTAHSAKKGTISVDLIETVHHEPERPVNAGRRPKAPAFRAPQPAAQPAPPQSASAAHLSSPEMQAYIIAVLKEINKRKVYPLEALDRGEEGKVVVGVSVAGDGQVLDVRVEEPSASSRLNQAAVETVKSIHALPALPSSISAPVHLHIPLVYRVESH